MSEIVFTNPGHCTRCTQPFGEGAPLFMVLEKRVAWRASEVLVLHSPKTVPVCEECATDKERASVQRQETCQGCGHPMLVVNAYWHAQGCSNRCSQRISRARHRLAREAATCEACGTKFIPAKAHAKFCSAACKQRAYRIRLSSQGDEARR